MNNRLSGLPEIVSFAMPGGDEQADLDGRATAYLAEEGEKPESFTGLPVHLASSKG